MIDGIQFDISTNELKEHLMARVAVHEKKAILYSEKSNQFHEVISDEDGQQKMSSMTNNNPVDTMRAGAKRHRIKASLFKFMANHLVQNETYRLSESDLGRLELTESEY